MLCVEVSPYLIFMFLSGDYYEYLQYSDLLKPFNVLGKLRVGVVISWDGELNLDTD